MEGPSRLLAFLVALPPAALAVIIMVAAFSMTGGLEAGGPDAVERFLAAWRQGGARSTWAIGAGFYVILVSWFLFKAWPRPMKGMTLLARTPDGKVQISRLAVEGLIRGAVAGFVGIRGLRVRIRRVSGGIAIVLHVASDLKAALPALGEKIQQATRHILESAIGIEPKEIQITFEPVEEERKKRLW
ncbi:alkaline shock response membrane anchor protein AmaP [Heliobacterium gestii]|uniref:Alkaline shock response membrane anchor protein AmaP n=1 Tax=Heliomicrobium gestii TaxID=2699 RepID=A0A845LFN8_HELGE|nr:alkaline shock response membrane anchor protein AmaP [Heliomicrobium gestii]MBM7867934.1 putative alkaline shock family protein YloU [Heliomicrobium gestii]MZP43255.1 alkaline shock response membrane anchor protein AmaP [Heliomicrobium gestii]